MCASALIKLYFRQNHESLEADQTWNQIKLILLYYYSGLYWVQNQKYESNLSQFSITALKERRVEFAGLFWGSNSYSLYFLTPYIIVIIFLMLIECQIYLPVVLYSGLTWNPINPFNHVLTQIIFIDCRDCFFYIVYI